MNFAGLSIGVWGTGVVGISALHFFKKNNAILSVYDNKTLSAETNAFCAVNTITVYKPDELESFLAACTYILPSAGINLKPYQQYQDKFLSEVDIFFEHYKKPIIAITGTVGKTTVTHAIKKMLEYYGYRIQIGGNIGVGLFDLLDNQAEYDYAVLELSSFQLELTKSFAPSIAIWTNLYANHLDRHGTMHEYFLAKLPVLKNQFFLHHALIHDSVKEYLENTQTQSTIKYFNSHVPKEIQQLITEQKTHTDHYIILYELTILLKLDLQKLAAVFDALEVPEHRVQHVGTSYSGVDFYDDSKSTVVEATQGALTRFTSKPVILFFGGVSKGVSRKHFFDNLPSNLEHIFLFGKEAQELHKLCQLTSCSSSAHQTLEDAFAHCISLIKPGDIVLFSPGGASFDLFADYKQRGKRFQELVKNYTNSLQI
jgi:UDP-N-acetylmuramoylalanine--D-glutamate ligase